MPHTTRWCGDDRRLRRRIDSGYRAKYWARMARLSGHARRTHGIGPFIGPWWPDSALVSPSSPSRGPGHGPSRTAAHDLESLALKDIRVMPIEFVIDPKGIIRTVIYYPLSLGRNFDELYRVIIALQTADTFGVATPADWRLGDDVIVPTAGSCGTAKERMESKDEMKCYDWFFCTKEISKEKVLSTILKK